MTGIEFIGIALGSSVVSSVVISWIERKKNKESLEQQIDMRWKDRIKFLNEQIEGLESRVKRLDDIVCYNESCKLRQQE